MSIENTVQLLECGGQANLLIGSVYLFILSNFCFLISEMRKKIPLVRMLWWWNESWNCLVSSLPQKSFTVATVKSCYARVEWSKLSSDFLDLCRRFRCWNTFNLPKVAYYFLVNLKEEHWFIISWLNVFVPSLLSFYTKITVTLFVWCIIQFCVPVDIFHRAHNSNDERKLFM